MAQSKNEMSAGCFTSFMLFFLLISAGLLYWGYSEYTFTRTVMQQNILVMGTVIDLDQATRNPGNQRHSGANTVAPRLEFVYEQDTIQYQSDQYSNIVDHYIGDEVEIFVNPDKPSDSVINTWSEKWGAATLLFALGGLFFLISSISLVSSLFSGTSATTEGDAAS